MSQNTSPTPARHRHIEELTGLRGLAALHVYFMHFYGVFCDYADSAQNVTDYGPETPPLTPFFIGNSQNSVTMFFVLSGFVLTIIYSQGFANRSETKSYYMKRIARIAPVYWFCLLFFLPIIFTSYWWNDFLNIFGGERHKIAALILTPFGLQSWSPLHVFWQQWNPPSWSVSCELFFYLAFPVLIHRKGLAVKTWKAFGKTIGKLVGIEFILFIAWFGVVFAFTSYILGQDQITSLANGMGVAAVFPPIRIFDFAIGVCTAKFYLETKDTPPKSEQWANRVGNAAVLIVLGLNCLPFPVAIGIAPADALLIYTLARGWGVSCAFLRLKGCLYLGKWSYALYLIHQPILGVMSAIKHGEISPIIVASLGNNFEGGLERHDIFLATVIVLIVSAGLHHLLEEPARRSIVKKWNDKHSPEKKESNSL